MEIFGIVFVGVWTGNQMTVHKYGFTTSSFQPSPIFMSKVSEFGSTFETRELAVMMTGLEEPDSTFVEKLSKRKSYYVDGPFQMFTEMSIKSMAEVMAKNGKILRKGRLFENV
jgi:hypothetical protein